MIVGYARTSTVEQDAGLEAQVRDLEAAGCERVFREQVSSVGGKRAQFLAALDFVRDGDVLVVTKPDRLARSMVDLMGTLDKLKRKGTTLRILSMNMDTGTPTGKLMLTVLGGVAEFERDIMLERQREGIAKAKQAGKYRGRAPTAQRQAEKVRELKAQGMKPAEIAKTLGISRASVYRIIAGAAE